MRSGRSTIITPSLTENSRGGPAQPSKETEVWGPATGLETSRTPDLGQERITPYTTFPWSALTLLVYHTSPLVVSFWKVQGLELYMASPLTSSH